MPPIGDEHSDSIEYVSSWLGDRIGRGYIPKCQSTTRLAGGFSPDPDLALTRWIREGYSERQNPGIADVLLIIEVADSSLEYNLIERGLACARAGAPELSVVDIPHPQVHVLLNLSHNGY